MRKEGEEVSEEVYGYVLLCLSVPTFFPSHFEFVRTRHTDITEYKR